MAAATSRDYDDVTLPGAANTTKVLRAAIGQDPADNDRLPLEVFIASEEVGVSDIDYD